jgi:hypothetical protein
MSEDCRVIPGHWRAPFPRAVAMGWLDFDDPGAEIGELQAAARARNPFGKFNDDEISH